MAKIHVRGGSPLRLEFEDDAGKTLDVRLDKASKGEYWVMTKDSNGKERKLQTHKEAGKNIFTETNPDEETCEISYVEKEKAFA